MEDQFQSWMPYLFSALIACLGAIGTAAGFLSRKVWVGVAYYADKVWKLTERAAGKHFEFMDEMSSNMQAQTSLLDEIRVDTKRATEVIDALGSDPTKSGEIKMLVAQLKDSPRLCNYSKEELEKCLKLILKHRSKQVEAEKS